MKKVRFESPLSISIPNTMNDSECHSPRPYIEKRADISATDLHYNYPRLLPFSIDPVHRFESSNTSPYPMIEKTAVDKYKDCGSQWSPSNDLELSFLDTSNHEPRKPVLSRSHDIETGIINMKQKDRQSVSPHTDMTEVLSSIENTKLLNSSSIPSKENSFFIKKGNLDKMHYGANSLHKQLNRLTLDKENNPLSRKVDLMRAGLPNHNILKKHEDNILCMKLNTKNPTTNIEIEHYCSCHHCLKLIENKKHFPVQPQCEKRVANCCNMKIDTKTTKFCECLGCSFSHISCHCNHHVPLHHQKVCNCNKQENSLQESQNVVDKKTWAIEKYERDRKGVNMVVEKSVNLKEKREPTVSDLFKIIKLQNEQLQLLQEKVDRFISVNKPNIPIQDHMSEQIALETVDQSNHDKHKISIGVMTSFEMVRTSTIINKEIVKQTSENAQIQCNRSQISIKEVISKSQPVNQNFLEGISPVVRTVQGDTKDLQQRCVDSAPPEHGGGEKTFNELSLHNIHVDNAITPLMSPEQTLYLDVRDYSDSDCGSNDRSNVGWTYYNKVMTHVNGLLQDSDIPSSASAMYRNTRQQCVQMQIDKTNVSVTKRVKFGDDPLGLHQPHIYAASTETSLKMNQLAAKYLKAGAVQSVPQQPMPTTKTHVPNDMSFATRNYMERHKLLQGLPGPSSVPLTDIPRFLDITTLKQQPKFL